MRNQLTKVAVTISHQVNPVGFNHLVERDQRRHFLDSYLRLINSNKTYECHQPSDNTARANVN